MACPGCERSPAHTLATPGVKRWTAPGSPSYHVDRAPRGPRLAAAPTPRRRADVQAPRLRLRGHRQLSSALSPALPSRWLLRDSPEPVAVYLAGGDLASRRRTLEGPSIRQHEAQSPILLDDLARVLRALVLRDKCQTRLHLALSRGHVRPPLGGSTFAAASRATSLAPFRGGSKSTAGMSSPRDPHLRVARFRGAAQPC